MSRLEREGFIVQVNRRGFLKTAPLILGVACGFGRTSRFGHDLALAADFRRTSRFSFALAHAFDAPYHIERLRLGSPLTVVEQGRFAYVMQGRLVLGCLPPQWKERYELLVRRNLAPEIRLESTDRTSAGRLDLIATLSTGTQMALAVNSNRGMSLNEEGS